MTDSNTLCLVDLSSIYWAAWHSSANDEVSAALPRTLQGVQYAINGCKYVAICCDSGRSFRKDLYPEYKANRPEKDHSAITELLRVKERLRADGRLLWEAEGFEADDVIATASNMALQNGMLVRIATADKDLMQLVNENVHMKSTRTGDILDAEKVHEKLGIWPAQVADYLSLVGDSSDNIKGVKGVGPKRAVELLHKFGSVKALKEALVRSPQDVSTPAIVDALLRACAPGEGGTKSEIDLARELIDLRFDVPIEFDQLFQEREAQPLTNSDYTPDSADRDLDDAPEIVTHAPRPQQEGRPEEKTPQVEPDDKPEPVKGELVTLPQQSFDLQLEPSNWRDAWAIAKGIHNSRLYQRKFTSQESVFVIIVRGREMGMGAITALDNFHVIEGAPALHAHLILARAKNHPKCEYFQFLGGDATYAEYETKHRNNPKPTRHRYTIEQAREAGLLVQREGKKKGPWLVRPDEMLRKTCGVQLARIEYPDASQGLYAIEELGYE